MSAVADLIRTVAPLCREHGIRRVRLADGTELEFGVAPEVEKKQVEAFKKMVDSGLPNDTDALFWSAPGFLPNDSTSQTPLPVAPAE